jgi:arginyl-tRNA synthetase
MTDPQIVLTERVQQALAHAFGSEHADADPLIRPSQFADFQANVALSLAKRLRRAPREVAEAIKSELSDFPGTVEVSGPGFLNITLDDTWIAAEAHADGPAARRRHDHARADRGDRLLRAQRGQGDARRPPAHHHRR